jgi:hypothetical protein
MEGGGFFGSRKNVVYNAIVDPVEIGTQPRATAGALVAFGDRAGVDKLRRDEHCRDRRNWCSSVSRCVKTG